MVLKLKEQSGTSSAFPRFYIKPSIKSTPSFKDWSKPNKVINTWKGMGSFFD